MLNSLTKALVVLVAASCLGGCGGILYRYYPIQITVRDAHGQPVEGAEVRVSTLRMIDPCAPYDCQSSTGADGIVNLRFADSDYITTLGANCGKDYASGQLLVHEWVTWHNKNEQPVKVEMIVRPAAVYREYLPGYGPPTESASSKNATSHSAE